MVGNWDFLLGPPETGGCGPLMNTEVLVHADGSLTLVPADFDLSALVVGEVRNPTNNQREPISAENAVLAARAYLAANLEGEPEGAVAVMRSAYLAKRAELAALIDASLVDEAGKAGARTLLDGFFRVLEEQRGR